ncbi:unnamed protein product [Owenia fusiformis]|uniref:Uncharacterized protein n=1 Tax=Owenia fusiformis TaxID=6347 RepID=A0A8J1UBR5_OWEFU|nr:unnamed protein product [Owenia fusiformis]
MPFLGQDWRGPGEEWVKTTEGWDRLKLWRLRLLENLNENIVSRILKEALEQNTFIQKDEYSHCHQPPHVLIPKHTTKECTGSTSLAESFSKLDMVGAARDPRRFAYTCKVLQYFIRHNFGNLSGTAQKYILTILEEAFNHVLKTGNNIKQVHRLLIDLTEALNDNAFYPNHVGSLALHDKHNQTVQKMERRLNNFKMQERKDDGKLTLSDLPDDCIRNILVQLSDHIDLVHSGETQQSMYNISSDNQMWKQMCLFHFNDVQLATMLQRLGGSFEEGVDWKLLYKKLVRRHGTKDVYAVMIHSCNNCGSLYWESHGHPCHFTDLKASSTPMTPQMFARVVGF